MMLSEDQCRSLRCLAKRVIPASAEYGVPSAGDDAIFGDILQSLGHDAGSVIAVMQTLDAMSSGPLADLDPHRRDAIAAQLRETGGAALAYLTRIILQRLRGGTRRLVPLGSVRARPKLYREAFPSRNQKNSAAAGRTIF
jgi:hypothetical protein